VAAPVPAPPAATPSLASLPRPRLLIDGELRGAAGAADFPIENPATGEVIGHAPDAAAKDADAAIEAARRAFDETAWATSPALRARCLGQLKDALDAHFEALRAITIAEAGVPRLWTDGPQLRMPVDGLGYLVPLLEGYEWEQDLGLAAPLGVRTVRRICREAAGFEEYLEIKSIALQAGRGPA
jgi:aldehyde dehydrogenase (NAD+)